MSHLSTTTNFITALKTQHHAFHDNHERTRPTPPKRRTTRTQRDNGWKYAALTLRSHLHLRTNALRDAGPSLYQEKQAGGPGNGSAAPWWGCGNAASGVLGGAGAEGTGEREGSVGSFLWIVGV